MNSIALSILHLPLIGEYTALAMPLLQNLSNSCKCQIANEWCMSSTYLLVDNSLCIRFQLIYMVKKVSSSELGHWFTFYIGNRAKKMDMVLKW